MEFLEIIFKVAHAATEAQTETDPGVIGLFGLNWKLFIAQLVNFAIVLFVLWKWVFTPITQNLTKRTQKIEQSLNKSEQIELEKQNFDQWKQDEIKNVRQEAGEIISKARTDAETLKSKMVSETKLEQENLTAQALQQIEQNKVNALNEIKGKVASLVTEATETIIKEKLTPEKDQKLINESLSKAKI